jgi:hypothetical protein
MAAPMRSGYPRVRLLLNLTPVERHRRHEVAMRMRITRRWLLICRLRSTPCYLSGLIHPEITCTESEPQKDRSETAGDLVEIKTVGAWRSGSAPALGAGGRWFESSRPDIASLQRWVVDTSAAAGESSGVRVSD